MYIFVVIDVHSCVICTNNPNSHGHLSILMHTVHFAVSKFEPPGQQRGQPRYKLWLNRIFNILELVSVLSFSLQPKYLKNVTKDRPC